MADTLASTLSLISKAWGRQKGYCFFPVISGKAADKEERIKSYQEGPAFRWPQDREKILEWLREHQGDDVYWCPSLFEEKWRRIEFAMDEHTLWADLDAIDPRDIDDYPPSVAWETSPGRYQALWLMAPGLDIQGASWRGGENHRMTYHLHADPSGWDTTQLLRIPGWPNHKPEYREKYGKPAEGKLLWDHSKEQRYMPDDFEGLPEIEDLSGVEIVVEDSINAVNRQEVWSRLRLRCSREVRDLVGSRTAQGDRSDRLWQIERDLADAGATAAEIVAIVRETVWNKYDGRQDELKRLTTEAAKAIAARPEKVEKQLEAEREGFPDPQPLFKLLENIKKPKWVVDQIWTEGGCGFVAGSPKSWKSWIALDMAMSVANGMDFLGQFRVEQPGPVLYIQEEDPAPVLKDRVTKMWPDKKADRIVVEDGMPVWIPASEDKEPHIAAYIKEGFSASDPAWQSWLDDQLEKGYLGDGEPRAYRMVILETLMRISGDVDENRAADMTQKLFAPLDQLADKHGVAIVIVHHMRKTGPGAKDGERAGQRMLGSVANFAWVRDALYVNKVRSGLEILRETKLAPDLVFNVTNLHNDEWKPRVVQVRGSLDEELVEDPAVATSGRSQGKVPPVLAAMREIARPVTKTEIKNHLKAKGKAISPQGIYQQLKRAEDKGLVERSGTQFKLTELGESTRRPTE